MYLYSHSSYKCSKHKHTHLYACFQVGSVSNFCKILNLISCNKLRDSIRLSHHLAHSNDIMLPASVRWHCASPTAQYVEHLLPLHLPIYTCIHQVVVVVVVVRCGGERIDIAFKHCSCLFLTYYPQKGRVNNLMGMLTPGWRRGHEKYQWCVGPTTRPCAAHHAHYTCTHNNNTTNLMTHRS